MPPDPASPPLAALLADARWMQALARRLTDPEAAEDLVQEGWLVVLEQPPREAHSARVWFQRVLTNLARMQRRGEAARGRRERVLARDERLESAAEVVERAEAQRRLVEHVLALEEPYRSTVLWRFFDGLSSAAIARRAGVPDSTVRTRLARGLAELRRRLEGTHGEAWAALVAPLARRPGRIRVVPPGVAAGIGVVAMKTVLVVGAVLVLVVLWRLGSREAPAPELAQATPAPAARSSTSLAAPVDPELAAPSARDPLPSTRLEQRAPAPDECLGRVTTRAGEPIAGAEVRVVQPFARQWPRVYEERELEELERVVATVLTDERGLFHLSVPAHRLLDLVVTAADFAPERRTNLYGGERQEIVLARAAAITGRVTRAPDGAPVEGVLVEFRRGVLTLPGGSTRITRTDADGRYHLGGLAPGYYRGTFGHVLGFGIVLGEGEEARGDETFPASRWVEGHVTDGRTDTPLFGASVWVESEQDAVLTDEQGFYRLTVEREKVNVHTLFAQAPGFGRFERSFGPPPEAGSVLDIFLLPGRSAVGRVVDADGAPVSGAYVTAAADGRSDDSGAGMRARPAPATTDTSRSATCASTCGTPCSCAPRAMRARPSIFRPANGSSPS